MIRTELRNAKLGKTTAAGNVKRELKELQKIQESEKDIMTITVTCGEFFTIICC